MNSTPVLWSALPTSTEYEMLAEIARQAQSSTLYSNVGSSAKIMMILLTARELGIPPMLALNGGIWNIQGKVEISAKLMNGLIRRAGHSITVEVSNDKVCTLVGKRADNGDVIRETFTIEMASKAGLSARDTWKKYPEDMLYNRCMSRLARKLFPDVIGTAYVEGEIKESREGDDPISKIPESECEDITAKEGNKSATEPLTSEQATELASYVHMLPDDIYRAIEAKILSATNKPSLSEISQSDFKRALVTFNRAVKDFEQKKLEESE